MLDGKTLLEFKDVWKSDKAGFVFAHSWDILEPLVFVEQLVVNTYLSLRPYKVACKFGVHTGA